MNIDFMGILDSAIFVIGILYSIILHELGHGFTAYLFGDPTARNARRLSLNPVPHIDIIGSVILPLICFITQSPIFGWAKPVPINPYNFSNRKAGEIVVSLAGITINFILMIIFIFLLGLTHFQTFIKLAWLNFILFYFNLIPLPPLDGYHFIINFLPARITNIISGFVESNSRIFLIVILLIIGTPIGNFLFAPARPLFEFLAQFFLRLFNFGS